MASLPPNYLNGGSVKQGHRDGESGKKSDTHKHLNRTAASSLTRGRSTTLASPGPSSSGIKMEREEVLARGRSTTLTSPGPSSSGIKMGREEILARGRSTTLASPGPSSSGIKMEREEVRVKAEPGSIFSPAHTQKTHDPRLAWRGKRFFDMPRRPLE